MKRLFRMLAVVGVGAFFVGLLLGSTSLLTIGVVLTAIGVIGG